MSLEPSLLIVNSSQQLKSFVHEGVYFNHVPITSYGVFEINNMKANENYIFNVIKYSFDILPISIACSGGTAPGNNDDFFFELLTAVGVNPFLAFNLSGKTKNLGVNGFTYDISEIPLRKEYFLQLRSSKAYTRCSLFFKKCFVEEPVSPY